MTNFIYFASGYKYQLKAKYEVMTGIIPPHVVLDEFMTLDLDGKLTLESGYACDGPSGPTLDTVSVMRAAFEHDAFYQMIRAGLLPESYKQKADSRFRSVLIEDAKAVAEWNRTLYWVCRARAELFYLGVVMFGGSSIKPSADKVRCYAPVPPMPATVRAED